MNMPTESNTSRSYIQKRVNKPLVIHVEKVKVYYRLTYNRPTSLKEFAVRWVRRDMRSGIVKALDGVSIKIRSGEVFGIIGRNGAGKSTLLKIISGILHPSNGRVRVWGRVVSLLGIGAGFHPELTGRENIYLYSSILGRSHNQTTRFLDTIVDFAEIEDFIDSPLRVYSTGMVARLGFAVAMADRPEILLVDEVLGVGDEKFRKKCELKFRDFRREGTTIVIVTHSMNVVESMCRRALWLVDGRVGAVGKNSEVVTKYRDYLEKVEQTTRIRPD